MHTALVGAFGKPRDLRSATRNGPQPLPGSPIRAFGERPLTTGKFGKESTGRVVPYPAFDYSDVGGAQARHRGIIDIGPGFRSPGR